MLQIIYQVRPLPTLLTFVALPLALGAPVTFARLSRASFMYYLLAPPPCRAGPSTWLALWYGMVAHWLSGHFLEYSPRNSFSNLKQHYSAATRGKISPKPKYSMHLTGCVPLRRVPTVYRRGS